MRCRSLGGVDDPRRARARDVQRRHQLVAVLQDRDRRPSKQIPGALLVNVNGLPHQAYFPAVGPNGETNPLYNRTYDAIKGNKLDDVLVIGAGGGNDVSVALKRGAKHVDAVEIDPRLYDLGKSHHPDRPYSDPRVDAHIGDGRAFLESTDKKYDLIVLALPDSLTLVSGNSALRLESYLFTKEAFEAARDHLKPDGVFSLYNYYREGWLIDRYAGTARDVFGHDPCVIGLGPEARTSRCSSSAAHDGDRELRRRTASGCPSARSPRPRPTTIRSRTSRTRSIPSVYSVSMALILAVSIGLILLALYPWKRGIGARSARCSGSPTSSSWVPRSCCSRPRTWCSSRCSSARPGSSTRSCSSACS